jgi:hypothetical protein
VTVRVEMRCDKSVREPQIEAVKSFSELNCCFGLGLDTGFGFGLSSARQWLEKHQSGMLDRGFESRPHHQMEWYGWVAPSQYG